MRDLKAFIDSVHRRWILIHLVERAGIGLLIGCAFAGALLPILLWREQSVWPILVACLAMGALAGLVAGWGRRPTRLAAAVEADRQLEQFDLLATAYSLPDADANEWIAVVRTEAERRVRTLSPNAIVLRRLGSRAWGGIGLSAALLIVVGLMFAEPTATRAKPSTAAERSSGSFENPQTARQSLAAQISESAGSNRRGPDDRSQHTASEAASGKDPARATNASPNRSDSAGQAASGAGSARSDVSQPTRSMTANAAVRPSNATASGTSTFAAGESRASDAGDGATAGVVAPTPGDRPTPPWQRPSWRNDRIASDRTMRDGTIPDSYRDVIREYFDHDANRD